MLIVKVKTFGVGWFFPNETATDTADRGFVRIPLPRLDRVKFDLCLRTIK